MLIVVILAVDAAGLFFISDILKPVTSEDAARNSCKRIGAAEDMYHARYGEYVTLEELGKAGYLGSDLANGISYGYLFDLNLSRDRKGWLLTAEPAVPGESGLLAFSLRQAGAVRLFTEEPAQRAGPSGDSLLRVDSLKLKDTVVTGHMETPITKGGNLLYCSSFRLAWNRMKDSVGGDAILLKNGPETVKLLNRSLFTGKDISEDAYLVMAGANRDGILEKLNEGLRKKFGNEAPAVRVGFLTPEDYLVYGFLLKNLRFKQEFERIREPLDFKSESRLTRIKAFGVGKFNRYWENDSKIRKQVAVIDYQGRSDFIVRLGTDSPEDEIILAKVKPKENLLKTIERVIERIERGRGISLLDNGDTLKIPQFNFDITHSYDEFLGKFFENKGFEKFFITAALQTIRFKLDEKGALLKSSAVLSRGMGVEPVHQPREYVFDGPFLIYLKEKRGKYPYFALWVENPELLLKY